MTRAAELLKAVRENEATQVKLLAMKSPTDFIKLAEKHGHHMTLDNLEAELNQLTESELAAMYNPGVGSRQRLIPR